MRPALLVAALAALAIAGEARAAVPAPNPGIASFAELKAPLPYPYDEKADADASALAAKVARAKAQAKREHKLLLVDYGGNWCPDCRILAGTMQLPPMQRFVDDHYVEVTVDSGRHMDQNLQVAARYGVPKLEGVPNVLVVDPRTDKLVNAGHTAALADARHMSPQALADWLARWPQR
jgi:thiol:disulfide interchange protein